MKFKIIFVIAILVGTTAAFQLRDADVSADERTQIGTINGKPLLGAKPSQALNTFTMKHGQPPATDTDRQELAAITTKNDCEAVNTAIKGAARDSEKARLGVYVSPDEVAEATKQYWAIHDPSQDMQKQRAHWIANSQAASAVFDQHQDPEKVYQTLLAPIGENHQAWEINLKRWSRPEARAALTKMAAAASNWNVETFKKGMQSSAQQMLERRKVDDAVDSQLAAQDSHYRTDLAEQKKGASGNIWQGREGPQSDYLIQKRQQFWQSRYAEQQVKLNDPNLATQCQLDSIGVKVAAK